MTNSTAQSVRRTTDRHYALRSALSQGATSCL